MTDTIEKIAGEMRVRADRLRWYNAQFASLGDALNWAADLNALADRLLAMNGEAVSPRFVGNMTDTHHLRALLEQAHREQAKFIPLHPIELRELLDAVAHPAPPISEGVREAVKAIDDAFWHGSYADISDKTWQTIRAFMREQGVE